MAEKRALALDDLCLDDLQPLLGHRFRIALAECSANEVGAEVELIDVVDCGRTRVMDGKQCFSAVFRLVSGPEWFSGSYRVLHEGFEIPLLYLSRIRYSLDPRDRNAYYELVFN
jgi:hypothetical protein